jgi:SAM-dependent methyltransferase
MREDFAEEYGDIVQWHWWFEGRRNIIASVLRRERATTRPRKILSLGCGPAEGLRWLLPFVRQDGELVGMDSDPKHGRSTPEGVTFVTGSIEAPPFANNTFDIVLAMDVLEHVDDDTKAVISAARLVRPEGLFLITVPAFPFLWGGQDVISHHRRRYTKKTLGSLLRRGGLCNYRINYFNTFLFPIAAVIRATRRLVGTDGRARSDFEGSRPGVLNNMLSQLFSAEKHLVNRVPLPFGVSLLATCRM